jgi:hypothetical protein
MLFPPEIELLLNGICLGRKLPPRARFFMGLLKVVSKKVQDVINDPERRASACHAQARVVRKTRTKDRAASARAAVREAKQLVHLASLTGKANWEEGCRVAGISRRTADNLLALLVFSERHPKLFKTFACLGRTKLYAIARLPKDLLDTLDPESEVSVGDAELRLKDLSDRELLAFLREVWPVEVRKRMPTPLRKHVLACREILATPSRVSQIGLGELKTVARETQELFRDLQGALKRAS